ncbi:MAG: ribonuclease HII [Candidatus Thermoplasmatota archaeon]|jgi:ribonuclease HII|nr:ribonuclease HII [Euryarchaeota archaeon]MEC7704074.1 ribonuclease HII [Candidatus Thermoplasmatota archaeon]MEC9090449.1 ribonuclease HII [Candidatus Thermoplasmatota archaeon]MED5487273.1 ribonuclease HII [Candidatus Thermoplasmatota archaeon]|tara:strand:+ start:125 stop:853 length:729 start_codon:yes stop_codon:yes gene_type:complete
MFRIGIDEAGRGPVIGPLVVAGFRVPENDLSMLEEVGITDSKLLSLGQRNEIYEWLHDNAEKRDWGIHVRHSNPGEIDNAMALTNLNEHEVSLFSSVARNLQTGGGGILQLDACDTDANRFGNNVASRLESWPWDGWSMDSRHGADLDFLAVGAASIIAKVNRDRAIEGIKEDIGIDFGSGYPSDPKTIASIEELISGESPHDCLRWGWATVRNAWMSKYGTDVPKRPVDGDIPPNPQRTLF